MLNAIRFRVELNGTGLCGAPNVSVTEYIWRELKHTRDEMKAKGKCIELIIYGNPRPQLRPRFVRRGKFVGTYDPPESGNWKESIRWQAIQQKVEILEGALFLDVWFWLQRPKSLPKKVKHAIKKPDLDNLVKAVKDALEGICYKNDSQFIDEFPHKRYAVGNEKPRVEIEIRKIEEE